MTRSNPPPTMTAQAATDALHAHLLLPMDGLSMPDHLLAIDLLDAGADINARDRDGLPPLLRCLSWSYSADDPDVFKEACHDMLDTLLARGADLAALTPAGQSHADLATLWQDAHLASKKLGREAYRRSQPDLAARIGKIGTDWPKPGESATDNTKKRFLQVCYDGKHDEAVYLLHLYPDAVHWQATLDSHKKCNALIAAVCGGNSRNDMLALLLPHGAPVDMIDASKRSALSYAVLVDARCCTQLMQAGANENLVDGLDRTPLELAQTRANSDPSMLAALQAVIDARRAADHCARAQDTAATHISTILTHHRRDGAKFKLKP